MKMRNIVVLCAFLGVMGCSKPLPKLGQVPEFKLTERGGSIVTRQDLMGTITVVDFIFTSCSGTCPVMTGQLSRLQKAWGSKGVRLWSITVDPDRDKPAKLKTYAEGAGAADGWLFLTGDKKTIFQLAVRGFKLTAMENPDGTPGDEVWHSTKFALVDKTGEIRGYYDGTKEEEYELMQKDLGRLLREK